MRRTSRGFALAILLVTLAACTPADEAPAAADAPPPASTEVADTPSPAASPAPLNRSTVEIYFPSTFGDGLVGKYSEIFQTVTPGDQAKQIIADLIADPDNPEDI